MNTTTALLSFILLLAMSSCMKERPHTLPENLEWNPQLAFPLGEEAFGLNNDSGFDTTLFQIDSLSSLPTWADESQLQMERILNFDLSSITDNLDQLNRILFRVNCSNQFPHQVKTQAYFLLSSGYSIDSLFQSGPVDTPPGRVDLDGSITEAGYSRHDAIIESDRIPGLEDAVSLLFRCTILIEEADTALIPFYPDFSFDIDAGLMLDLSFEL